MRKYFSLSRDEEDWLWEQIQAQFDLSLTIKKTLDILKKIIILFQMDKSPSLMD